MTEHKRKRSNGAPPRSESLSHSAQLIDSEEIARRAFELYQRRGGEDGHDWEDWFRAEGETMRSRESSG